MSNSSIAWNAQAAKNANEIFRFIDPVGTECEAEILPGTFFCVIVGGHQVGDPHHSAAAADAYIKRLVDNNAHLTLVTVETYRQTSKDDLPAPATPYFIRGCWTNAAH